MQASKTTIFLVLLFFVAIRLAAQSVDTGMFYVADNLPLRDMYIIQDNKKIVTLRNNQGVGMLVLLMNEHNLIVDTLGRFYALNVVPVGAHSLIIEVPNGNYFFAIEGERAIQTGYLHFCDNYTLSTFIVFQNNLFVINGWRKKANLEIGAIDTADTTCLQPGVLTQRVFGQRKFNLKPGKGYGLQPVGYGLSRQGLVVFLG